MYPWPYSSVVRAPGIDLGGLGFNALFGHITFNTCEHSGSNTRRRSRILREDTCSCCQSRIVWPQIQLLILSVCALLLCCVAHLQWLLQLFPFQVDQVICGFYVTLFSLVCFVCIVEIFMPRVSSLQSLTLDTRSVFCSSPHNLVSDTGHKCAPLWIIWTHWAQECLFVDYLNNVMAVSIKMTWKG